MRITFLAAAAALGLAGWYASGTPQPPATPVTTVGAIDEALKAQRGAYATAFNAGDAKAVAELFTADAEMTGVDGITIRGRAAIEAAYADLFKSEPKISIVVEPGELRSLGTNLAIFTGVSKIKHPRGGEEATIFSAYLSKDADSWKLASVTEFATDEDVGSLADLEWLVGTWTGKTAEGEMKVSYAWEDGKAFLHCKYQMTKDGKTLSLGSQMIGETDEGVHAWLFDSTGSTGESTWTKDGSHWTIQAARDDGATSMTHLVVKINKDTMTWQAIKRVIDGAPQPDSLPMKLTRSK